MGNILVVKRKILFDGSAPSGFIPAWRREYLSVIQSNGLWMEREKAEENPAFKQPIVYSVVANAQEKKIFFFRRANTKDYAEKKLRNKWSCGLGGHVDQIKDGNGPWPLIASAQRELGEELGLIVPSGLNVQGYINQEDDVGKVHFGILNVVWLSIGDVRPRDPEIAEGRMMDVDEAKQILTAEGNEAEGWTEICFPFLSRLFG